VSTSVAEVSVANTKVSTTSNVALSLTRLSAGCAEDQDNKIESSGMVERKDMDTGADGTAAVSSELGKYGMIFIVHICRIVSDS